METTVCVFGASASSDSYVRESRSIIQDWHFVLSTISEIRDGFSTTMSILDSNVLATRNFWNGCLS